MGFTWSKAKYKVMQVIHRADRAVFGELTLADDFDWLKPLEGLWENWGL